MDLGATVEARQDLGKDHERYPDLLTCRQAFSEIGIPPQQVGQTIGIERGPHFHLSGSIRR